MAPSRSTKEFSFEVVRPAAATPEDVFSRLYDAPHWKDWAGILVGSSSWERLGDPPPGGAGAVRKVGRLPFMAREEILVSQAPNHHAYTVKGMPVRDYRADVYLTASGTGTEIRWQGTFTPVVPGT